MAKSKFVKIKSARLANKYGALVAEGPHMVPQIMPFLFMVSHGHTSLTLYSDDEGVNPALILERDEVERYKVVVLGKGNEWKAVGQVDIEEFGVDGADVHWHGEGKTGQGVGIVGITEILQRFLNGARAGQITFRSGKGGGRIVDLYLHLNDMVEIKMG